MKNKIMHSKPLPLHGISILIVDDAPDDRELIARHLTNYGARPAVAENGLIGYQQALGGDYDAVLMDVQMPVLDGYGATRRLRNEGFIKPIIAMTAHATTETRQKCLDAGCTDHLAKPIDFAALTRKIVHFVNLNRPAKTD